MRLSGVGPFFSFISTTSRRFFPGFSCGIEPNSLFNERANEHTPANKVDNISTSHINTRTLPMPLKPERAENFFTRSIFGGSHGWGDGDEKILPSNAVATKTLLFVCMFSKIVVCRDSRISPYSSVYFQRISKPILPVARAPFLCHFHVIFPTLRDLCGLRVPEQSNCSRQKGWSTKLAARNKVAYMRCLSKRFF